MRWEERQGQEMYTDNQGYPDREVHDSQPGEVQTHKEPEEQNPETDRGDAWEEPDITPHPDPGQHSQHQQDSGCMEQSQTNQHIFCQKKIFPHWENKDHKKNKKIGKIRNLQ